MQNRKQTATCLHMVLGKLQAGLALAEVRTKLPLGLPGPTGHAGVRATHCTLGNAAPASLYPDVQDKGAGYTSHSEQSDSGSHPGPGSSRRERPRSRHTGFVVHTQERGSVLSRDRFFDNVEGEAHCPSVACGAHCIQPCNSMTVRHLCWGTHSHKPVGQSFKSGCLPHPCGGTPAASCKGCRAPCLPRYVGGRHAASQLLHGATHCTVAARVFSAPTSVLHVGPIQQLLSWSCLQGCSVWSMSCCALSLRA